MTLIFLFKIFFSKVFVILCFVSEKEQRIFLKFIPVNMKFFIQSFQHVFCLSIIYTRANALIGGQNVVPASPNEFPFIVSVGVAPANFSLHHVCGGILISKRHILTARHCFEDLITNEPLRNATDIRVTVGSIDNTSGRKYGIKSWITYSDWSTKNHLLVDGLHHDLAVVKLVEYVTDVTPVLISQCKNKQLRGRVAVTAGWGVVDGKIIPKFLQKTSIRVISRKKCRSNFVTVYSAAYMVVNHLCTVQEPPVILGCGDSGGPLLINGNELIGVNQGVCTENMNHPNEHNNHQSVEYYRRFIEAFAEKKVPCSISNGISLQ